MGVWGARVLPSSSSVPVVAWSAAAWRRMDLKLLVAAPRRVPPVAGQMG